MTPRNSRIVFRSLTVLDTEADHLSPVGICIQQLGLAYHHTQGHTTRHRHVKPPNNNMGSQREIKQAPEIQQLASPIK